jgi:hypothetical protein
LKKGKKPGKGGEGKPQTQFYRKYRYREHLQPKKRSRQQAATLDEPQNVEVEEGGARHRCMIRLKRIYNF